jgi:hypothetical protein
MSSLDQVMEEVQCHADRVSLVGPVIAKLRSNYVNLVKYSSHGFLNPKGCATDLEVAYKNLLSKQEGYPGRGLVAAWRSELLEAKAEVLHLLEPEDGGIRPPQYDQRKIWELVRELKDSEWEPIPFDGYLPYREIYFKATWKAVKTSSGKVFIGKDRNFIQKRIRQIQTTPHYGSITGYAIIGAPCSSAIHAYKE